MDTTKLKKFAQFARRTLISQVGARLELVLAEGAAARREHPGAIKKLEAAIAQDGKDQVIERVAYTWFNRFSALRFMDVNDLNPIRIVSPLSGQFQPEILAEAKAGNIDEGSVPEKVLAHVRGLLDARVSSADPQGEAYRLLLVDICNDWHGSMPFLFERIDDYTELLLPEDLLSNASILAYLREAMTPDVCKEVEVVGWLYQFYISEKKDEVFAGLKKNVKITAENIPAATQLFTPHWIVRYLVENSLGRLWMLNRPVSKLKERMDYYIAPEQPETDFLRISRPEEIKVCDPACGSGHMLTYAFDLLHAIYEEEGYDPPEIPALILKHNLTGLEIDDRASALAAFALVMKAAAKLGRRRFLRMKVKPDIVVLQNVTFTPAEMRDVVAVMGRDLFTDELRETLMQFEHAKNFGSLIIPKLRDPAETLREVEARDFGGDLLLKEVQNRIVAVLRAAEALSPKYHVVVANPPYMGSKSMNKQLADWSGTFYPESRFDLFAMFIERNLHLAAQSGLVAMITMQSWMFLSRLGGMRSRILSEKTFLSMAHLGERGFDSIGGAVVATTCFVLSNRRNTAFCGDYFRLVEGRSESEKSELFLASIRDSNRLRFRVSADEMKKIPGDPIAYWVSNRVRDVFSGSRILEDIAPVRQGFQTGDNDRFLRQWFEVSFAKIGLGFNSTDSFHAGGRKFAPYNKGGEYRRWFGNNDYVVDFDQKSYSVLAQMGNKLPSRQLYFQNSFTWTALSTGNFGARWNGEGYTFSAKGACAFPESEQSGRLAVALLNSNVAAKLFEFLSPTLDFNVGVIRQIPITEDLASDDAAIVQQNASQLIVSAKFDWDSYEPSWEFTTLPLLSSEHRAATLEATYAGLRARWQGMTDEMQRLEEENNRIFIDAYGLQDELTPEVPIEEVTLTCNPAYRYGVKGSEDDRETRLLADTMAEFLSYAVGCIFGRYSLDAPGLILANQGEMQAHYLARVPKPSFMPDEDNVIPVLDGDWFADDISDRFRRFLRVTFGEEHFQENLAFVEGALGKDIRQYFTRDFFSDHVKRYKKRPIYWLFSSPQGTFNALIYMHRYRPDTVSIVLNDYLRELRNKLEAYRRGQETLSISGEASQGQRTKALKEVEVIGKQIAELDAYERDVLFPRASQRIEIDLDDGVKANYPKFGDALKPIKGLSDADDD